MEEHAIKNVTRVEAAEYPSALVKMDKCVALPIEKGWRQPVVHVGTVTAPSESPLRTSVSSSVKDRDCVQGLSTSSSMKNYSDTELLGPGLLQENSIAFMVDYM